MLFLLFIFSMQTLAVITGSMGGFPVSNPAALSSGLSPTSSAITDKFDGTYLGLETAFIHRESTIETHSFSGTGISGGMVFGYGARVKQIYLAGELEVDYSSGKKMRDGLYQFKSNFGGSVAGRIGVPLQEIYVPYVRFGVGGHGYVYGTPTQNINFWTYFFIPGVGIEFFLSPHFMLRFETDYAIPVRTTKLKRSQVTKQPTRAMVKLGGSYKF